MNPIANSDDMDEFVSARGSEVMLREEGDMQDSVGLIETMKSDVDPSENGDDQIESTKKQEQSNKLQ